MDDKKGPEIIDKTQEELSGIIEAIKQSNLSETNQQFVIKCIELACWLPRVLQKKNVSLSRLKKLIFGKGYRGKHKKKKESGSGDTGNSSGGEDGSNIPPASSDSDSEAHAAPLNKEPHAQDEEASGSSTHRGRIAHEAYSEDESIVVSLNYTRGDRCPQQCGGKLYALGSGVVVRLAGQSFAKVTKYYLEKLRCNVCGYYLSAKLPATVAKDKYTASFKAQLAMMKFYLGVPYYRLARHQAMLGCPLPDSTQWQLIEKLGSYCYGLFYYLQSLAANGALVYNDDTHLKILDTIKQIKQASDPKRRGMVTTCVIGEHDGHQIVFYLNGLLHSGENLDVLLATRDDEKQPILQMSDALPANTPKQVATLACYCLSHGLRKFDELKEFFPNECIPVLRELSRVFAIDKKTRAMDDKTRLTYHQTHSRPILFALYEMIETLLAAPKTEPNNDLAIALRYLKNHWVKLTRFLSVPGAPICNNLVERALKLAIRTRKNSLFYKTTYSASLSGIITSLIATCELAQADPIDYLTVLQTYPTAIRQSPQAWLPWNYRTSLDRVGSQADNKLPSKSHRDPPAAIQCATDPPR